MKKLTVIVLSFLFAVIQLGAQSVDPKLPDYKRADNVGGNINSIGSDTLLNLMTFWSEDFRKVYPNVNFQIEGKGSSTAPPALIEGTSQLGPMSRKMKDSEIEKFEEKFGFKPTPIAIALDALAVFVHKENPIKELSLAELDAIFSSTRKSGYRENVDVWGKLGLTGSWSNRPISLYGRNSASGTYAYFKEVALFKGDYKSSVKEQPGSSAVVQAIGVDRYAVGYSGIGVTSPAVKVVAVSKKKGEKAYSPLDTASVYKGKYPVSRFLYVYIAKVPGKPLANNVKEFLKFILSKKGQESTIKDGYLPLPAKFATKQLKLLD